LAGDLFKRREPVVWPRFQIAKDKRNGYLAQGDDGLVGWMWMALPRTIPVREVAMIKMFVSGF
jgi:hypothetical protein